MNRDTIHMELDFDVNLRNKNWEYLMDLRHKLVVYGTDNEQPLSIVIYSLYAEITLESKYVNLESYREVEFDSLSKNAMCDILYAALELAKTYYLNIQASKK